MDIKTYNFKALAGRLFEATHEIGTDEEAVFKVARDLRAEIAQSLVDKKIIGATAVEKQNILTHQAMKYLGDAYSALAREKGDADLVHATGEETIENILTEELSGAELSLAQRLFAFQEYTPIDSDEGLIGAGKIGTYVAGAGLVVGAIFLTPFLLLGLLPLAGGYYYLHEEGNDLDRIFDVFDPRTIQGNAELKLDGENYYARSDFIVNEEDFHYYIDTNAKAAEKQLAQLAAEAEKEESWIYIRFRKKGKTFERFIENGVNEENGYVVGESDVLNGLLADKTIKLDEIRFYHIHPYPDKEFMGELFSSSDDIQSSVKVTQSLRLAGFKGKIEHRAVTPKGIYVLAAKKDASHFVDAKVADFDLWLENNMKDKRERDIVAGILATGLVQAKYIYHQKEMERLEKFEADLKKILANNSESGRRFMQKLKAALNNYTKAIAASSNNEVPERILKYHRALLSAANQRLT